MTSRPYALASRLDPQIVAERVCRGGIYGLRISLREAGEQVAGPWFSAVGTGGLIHPSGRAEEYFTEQRRD